MKVNFEWVGVAFLVGTLFGSEMLGRTYINLYRRWYLMCRNAVEELDPNHPVLQKIGPRTSARESWEGKE